MATKISAFNNINYSSMFDSDKVTGIHNGDNANFQLDQLAQYVFNAIRSDIERLVGSGSVSDDHINSLIDAKIAALNPYTLPTASASVLGGIKVGGGLTIDANGVLSVSQGGSPVLDGSVVYNSSNKSYTSKVVYIDSNNDAYIPIHKTLASPWCWRAGYSYVQSLPENYTYGDYFFFGSSEGPNAVVRNTTTGNGVWWQGDTGGFSAYPNFSQETGISVPNDYVVLKSDYLSGFSLNDVIVFELES